MPAFSTSYRECAIYNNIDSNHKDTSTTAPSSSAGIVNAVVSALFTTSIDECMVFYDNGLGLQDNRTTSTAASASKTASARPVSMATIAASRAYRDRETVCSPICRAPCPRCRVCNVVVTVHSNSTMASSSASTRV